MPKKYFFIFVLFIFLGIITFSYKKDDFKKNFFYLLNPVLNKLIYNHLDECMPKLIDFVPSNSIMIIGHAYGSHEGSEKRGNVGIAPKVKNFYESNKENIDMVIFSGDVLKAPNIDKWKKFYSVFKKNLLIYIAPGNHDLLGHKNKLGKTSFDLFKHKNNADKFPFSFVHKNNLFIIDDSNKLDNSLEEIYSLITKNKIHKNVFIIRHHVFPLALKKYANAKGAQSYINNDDLKVFSKINKERKITFIYGDGGAIVSKPRITCVNISNVNHIVSGIGEVNGDNVLIISNHKLFRKEIK